MHSASSWSYRQLFLSYLRFLGVAVSKVDATGAEVPGERRSNFWTAVFASGRLKGAGVTGEPSSSLRLPTTTTSSSPDNPDVISIQRPSLIPVCTGAAFACPAAMMNTDFPFGPLLTACGGRTECVGNLAQTESHFHERSGAQDVVKIREIDLDKRLRVEGSSAKVDACNRPAERSSVESLDAYSRLCLSREHPGRIVLRDVGVDADRLEIHNGEERNGFVAEEAVAIWIKAPGSANLAVMIAVIGSKHFRVIAKGGPLLHEILGSLIGRLGNIDVLFGDHVGRLFPDLADRSNVILLI